MKLKALSLFSGIGGLDLAAEMAGIETVALCEIEPFPVEVLKKRFPDVPIFSDVRKLKRGDIDESIDIIHGGFPCQDLSQAGKQRGLEGERSGLWFEMLRVISEFRPRYVLAENVRGAVNLALDTVYANLVNEGYKVYPYVIPASAVGAPHQRERLFVVGVRSDVAYGACKRLQRMRTAPEQESEVHAGETIPLCDSIGSGELWPTPRAQEPGRTTEGYGRGLQELVEGKEQHKLWPTPTGTERSGINPNTGSGAGLSKVNGGQLNPDWVGQLMGYPEGWTDLDVDEPREWAGWPALLGQEQYPYEFPRTTTGCKNRAKQLKAYGNSVVPAQAYPFFKAIAEIEKIAKEENNDR